MKLEAKTEAELLIYHCPLCLAKIQETCAQTMVSNFALAHMTQAITLPPDRFNFVRLSNA